MTRMLWGPLRALIEDVASMALCRMRIHVLKEIALSAA